MKILPLSCAAALVLVAATARAEGDRATDGAPAEPPVQRTWLYSDGADVAAPGRAVASSELTYTSSGVGAAGSPTRPFASNLATPGAMVGLGGEVGLAPRLSIEAMGVGGEAGRVGGSAGLRLSLLPASWATRAVMSAGYLRELGGENGAWARLTLTRDLGRVRLLGTFHGEHVFAGARDALDLMVVAGANVRVGGPLRLGAEYVGQDLEGALDDEAEGGVRHFVGPTASVVTFDDRLSFVCGPAIGLSYASPKLLGRAALSWSF